MISSDLRDQLVNLVMVIYEDGTRRAEVVEEVNDAMDAVDAARKEHPDSQADGFRE